MYYKNAFYSFITLFCFFVGFMLSVIYVYDPYMLFHKKILNKDEIYSDLRVQNYGLIKHLDFDNMILGSSMLENTSAYEANEKLGGKWLNLSYPGLRSFERFKIINFATNQRKIKNIIVTMDDHAFKPNHTEQNFEPDLYDNKFIIKYKIYMNSNALSCIFLGQDCNFKKLDMDHIGDAWGTNTWHSKRFGGFDNWLKVADTNKQIKDAFSTLLSKPYICNNNNPQHEQTINNEIIPLLKNNPDTEFHLIIPPYSALYWAHEIDNFDCKMEPYKYLIEQSQPYKNAHIYWLYDEKFVFDISTYKDLSHYDPKINSLQLDSIKNRSNIINTSNYAGKFKEFKNRLEKFDIDYYVNKIKKYTQEKD